MSAQGKAVYDLPMYVNAWLGEQFFRLAADYPSGGAVSSVLDIWLWTKRHLDLIAPDIYLPYPAGYRQMRANYAPPEKPPFVRVRLHATQRLADDVGHRRIRRYRLCKLWCGAHPGQERQRRASPAAYCGQLPRGGRGHSAASPVPGYRLYPCDSAGREPGRALP